jgi:hypothetical protein
MGTNYYRIPTEQEMNERKAKLINDISDIDMSPNSVERKFRTLESPVDAWSTFSPWDYFTYGTSVHLGKRSGGWKFCWNFNNNKYYSNKEQLLAFIRSGRVVNEYGEEENIEEFITMALEWGQPDGLVVNEEYRKQERLKGHGAFWIDSEKYDDAIIDGLRVSSSTDFS